MNDWIDGEDIDGLKKLLLYRKIVEAHKINDATGELVLDDGTVLFVAAANNPGPEQCDCGEWYLDDLNTCDNVITNVDIVYDANGCDENIQIFVYAEDTRIKAIEVSGNEGNGYYGRGFTISIEKP